MCKGNGCCDCGTKPENIVKNLEAIDGKELLAYWRNLTPERKSALKKKLFPLAMA